MGLMFKTLAKQRLRYRGFLFIFLLMALVVSVAGATMTRLTGEMGQAALDMDMTVLLRFFGIITAIMLFQAAGSAVSALILGRFAAKAGYRFRDNFAKYFLQKPFAAFEGTKSGETLSVFSNDLPAAVELVSNGGIRMIADVINLLVMLGFMLYLNWWLTLIFFASFPVLIFVQVVISVPIQKKSARRLETRAKASAIAADSFQNTGVVAAYSLENIMKERYRSSLEEWVDASKSMARSYLSLILAGILASVSPLLIIFAVAAYQVIAGNMNVSEMIAFTAFAGEAGGWLQMLSQRQNNIQTSAAGAKRMDEHMSAESENAQAGNTLTSSGNIAISGKGLKFSYGARADSAQAETTQAETGGEEPKEPDEPALALDDVSFEIKQGSRVAFIGGSGSGKSTVLKLLLGLYAPQEGVISVMGADTADVSLQSLRDIYSYVPQDSFLFPESILGNITGESTVTDRPRLEKACRDAGILDFIESLPGGFDAELGESAENVSGGQKQRIALARAFYRDAPIILFDEATSALDPVTEAAVLQSFSNALTPDKTVIMVAHRPEAIAFCDTIIVMDGGKIVDVRQNGGESS
ncbi:MAG: ABC transporter ATP-binding protein/permease [Defluviitaleaceae bacterium]|nr:ABC transporter ATP-binding protein/permease [Defluviitaleaceae bacterium]